MKDYKDIKYYITYSLCNKEKEFYRKHNFYVYDLRDHDFDNGSNIELNVLVNNIGSIITTKDLGLKTKDDYIDLDDFQKTAIQMEYADIEKQLDGDTYFHKVEAPIIDANGNVFNLIGICQRELKRNGYSYEAFALGSRIQNEAKSYDEALNIMQEYVIPVSCLDKNSDDMDLDI